MIVVAVVGDVAIAIVAQIGDYRLEAVGAVVGSYVPKSMAKSLENPVLMDLVGPFLLLLF